MEISQEEFEKMLKDLSDRNWKVKSLLDSFKSYDKLPQNVKNLIDKELKIKRNEVLTIED
jgi:hypothetical protein